MVVNNPAPRSLQLEGSSHFNSTGWTGIPLKNAPVLNWIKNWPFVVVPSGKMMSGG
jgi:hypothetical protein